MRSLWPIERAVFEAAAHDFIALADVLYRQMAAARVTHFKNTGAGFFSTVSVAPQAPQLPDKSPLDAAMGSVGSIEHEMGFMLFLNNGYVSLIEGYAFGDFSTVDVNFESVDFDMKPWSLAGK